MGLPFFMYGNQKDSTKNIARFLRAISVGEKSKNKGEKKL